MALNTSQTQRRAPNSRFGSGSHYDSAKRGESLPFWRQRIVVLGVSLATAVFACAAVLLLWKIYFAPQANGNRDALPSAPLLQTIKNVKFSGEFQYLRAQDLQLFSNSIRGNIWSVDLNEIRAAAQAYSWVRSADVRRSFPEGLAIRLEEHKPFAKWGENEYSFVNTFGEVFDLSPTAQKPKLVLKADEAKQLAPSLISNTLKMPVFIGPSGSAQDVVKHYQWLQQRFAPLGRQVAEVRLTVRGALRVRDNLGTVIELGRLQVDERLTRVLSAWPHVAAMQQPNMYIDARYPSGLALSANSNPMGAPAVLLPEQDNTDAPVPAIENEKLVLNTVGINIENLLVSQTMATGISR